MRPITLEASDIMLGDWVFTHYDWDTEHKNDKYVKIENIFNGYINTHFVNGEIVYGVPLKDCQPISITKELLEQIGFKPLYNMSYFQKGNHYIIVHHPDMKLGFIETNFEYRNASISDMDLVNYECYVCFPRYTYLHDLQHFLNMCNVRIDIDLTKIKITI